MNSFFRYIIGFVAALVMTLIGVAAGWAIVSFLTWEILPMSLPSGLIRFYVLWALVAAFFLMPKKA